MDLRGVTRGPSSQLVFCIPYNLSIKNKCTLKGETVHQGARWRPRPGRGRVARLASRFLCGHPAYAVPANSPPTECNLRDTLESTDPRDGSGKIFQIFRKVKDK